MVFPTPRFGGGPVYLGVENVAKLTIWTLPVLALVRAERGGGVIDYL